MHSHAEQYLDMLYSNNLLPINTTPTRITEHTATLNDHIYTNFPIANLTSDIITVDLSDHLPIFLCNKHTVNVQDRIQYRDYSKFNKELFLSEIQ